MLMDGSTVQPEIREWNGEYMETNKVGKKREKDENKGGIESKAKQK